MACICSRLALLTLSLDFLVSICLKILVGSSLEAHISFIWSRNESLTSPVPHGSVTSSCTDNGSIMAVHAATQAASLENAFHYGVSSSVPNNLPTALRAESVGNQSGFAESVHSPGSLKFDIHGSPAFHPHSLPEYHDGLTNSVNCSSPGNVSASINARPPERIDNRNFPRVSSKGHSIELNEGGKWMINKLHTPLFFFGLKSFLILILCLHSLPQFLALRVMLAALFLDINMHGTTPITFSLQE